MHAIEPRHESFKDAGFVALARRRMVAEPAAQPPREMAQPTSRR